MLICDFLAHENNENSDREVPGNYFFEMEFSLKLLPWCVHGHVIVR